jgi:RND family efflux transporter MFP subunit
MSSDLSSLQIDKSKRENYSSGKGKKWIIWTTGTVAIIILLFIFIGPLFSSSIEVQLTSALFKSPSESSAMLTGSGYVVAQRKAAVASKATGRLVYLGVVEGDKVKKGQIIAKIDNSDIEAQLAEAKANLELNKASLDDAKKNYERQKALFKTGAVSQSTLDEAETNYNKVLASIDVAKARVQQEEVALENTLIRAPFDGTVLTKNADVGEMVVPMGAGINARAAVVTMADMSSLQVEADVSESNIEKVSVGQPCQISLDAYPNVYYQGHVAKIIPTADRSKGTVTVKVAFNKYDNHVLPEMSAKIVFLQASDKKDLSKEKPVLVIPSSALTARNNKQVVFMVKDGKAVEVPVQTGGTFGDFIRITSGLNTGDQIIDNINKNIIDGTKVAVK